MDRLRDTRAALYLDLMMYTQNAESVLDQVTDPYRSQRLPVDGLHHEDTLTARVELYLSARSGADEQALLGPAEAWDELLKSSRRIDFAWENGDINEAENGQLYLSTDDPLVVKHRAAIASMKGALTRTLENYI